MQWQVRKKLLGTFIISVAFYLGSHLIYKVVDDKDRYCLEEDSGVGKWDRFFCSMDVQIFTFFGFSPFQLWFILYCWLQPTYSFLQGGQDFLLGVHIFLEDRG